MCIIMLKLYIRRITFDGVNGVMARSLAVLMIMMLKTEAFSTVIVDRRRSMHGTMNNF